MKQITNTIGVLGSEGGIGVTHSCILFANYLTSSRKQKVALIQYNESGAFQKIAKAFDENCFIENGHAYFELFGITYFSQIKHEAILQIRQLGYDCIIFDFGADYASSRSEFLRCQENIIIGSFTDWRKENFKQILRNLVDEAGGKQFRYLSLFGDEGECKKWGRTFGVHVAPIPFEPDPYVIHNQNFAFFEEVLPDCE